MVLGALVAAGGIVGYHLPRDPLAQASSAGVAASAVTARRELVMVYIGASTCGPSNDARLPGWLREAEDTLQLRARRGDASVVVVGVARELDVATGMAHLARMAAFDEVSAGLREKNHLSQKYISRDFSGAAATPQILILLREYDELPLGGLDAGSVRETLLLRRVGLLEIEHWLHLGTPIPSITSNSAPTVASVAPF